MVEDGRSIIDKRWVTFEPEAYVDTEDQIQPNGIDLRINKLYNTEGQVHVPQNGKVDADLRIQEVPLKDAKWTLLKDNIYMVDFLESISVPAEWCAILITRSSLVRSGVDVVSGLWDTGFKGTLGCTLRVHRQISIEWGAKLCQVMFHKSNFRGEYYTGAYQGTNSQTAIVR